MGVLDKLSSSKNRRDEIPNQELAKEILASRDKKAIQELVENLSNKDKNIASDCIKVLYEIGEHDPTLIDSYAENFLSLLNSKNNRLAWGAMTALDCIATTKPKDIFNHIDQIIKTANEGSVITRDHAVSMLIKLSKDTEIAPKIFPLFFDQLQKSPPNQLPMYAENSYRIIPNSLRKEFVEILKNRLPDMEKESKKKRVEKVIKRILEN